VIDLAPLRGSRFAVLGLARSGLATMKALDAARLPAVAWDDNAKRREEAAAAGIATVEPRQWDWNAIDLVVMSPGIPLTHPEPHPVARSALRHRKPIVCDIDLLARVQSDARMVGITGTNGKSTTTALIGHVLQQSGRSCEVGGNIGRAVLDFTPLPEDGVYVLELSSFQLDLLEKARFHVAVWLNITPDHIDRHGDLAGYVAAKRHIFERQRSGDTAVIGIDDDASRATFDLLARGPAHTVPIAVGRLPERGVGVVDGILHDRLGEGAEITCDLRSIPTLPGAHNWQNAAAAWAAARALAVPASDIARALPSYPGLPHRQERVASIAGTVYVNDSKATNADATEKALASYDTIYWILGGTPKEGGVASLTPLFGRVRHAFLVGQATEQFAAQLDGRLDYSRCGDLQTALQRASALAQKENLPGAVVLLSPACASYDQWPNYEVRGDAFRRMARALPGAVPMGSVQ